MKQRLVVVLLGISIAIVPAGRSSAASGKHCAIRLTAAHRHGVVDHTKAEVIGCFDTFAEALQLGSDGRIRVPIGTTPMQLTDQQVSAAASSSDVLIGTEFNIQGFGGSSNSYFAPSTCSANNIWETNYVGDPWNDYFSSGKGFGGCDHNKKFQAADFGGDVLTCTPNCADYGSGMSNQVSSLRWRP
jgi:hypothetical protein